VRAPLAPAAGAGGHVPAVQGARVWRQLAAARVPCACTHGM
jgi:hypothetical protein